MESASGWYRAVRTEQEGHERAATDSVWNDGYTLTPCRYITSKRHSWIFIDEENTIRTLHRLFARGTYITTARNPYADVVDEFDTFESNVEAGKNYLVGRDVATEDFLKTHTSSCSDWQVLAHAWALAHPESMLIIETAGRRKFSWQVYKRGNYVEFGLPHHGEGGEKHYVSRADKPTRKVLVNVD
jgi:hypothetical protein